MNYKNSGVDIDNANSTKKQMANLLKSNNHRLLNGLGDFASLFDFNFPEYENPVLVFKTEEPGSKTDLVIKYGDIKTIGYDLINHLINDIIVMGAKPLTIQDCIITGKINKEVILRFIEGLKEACEQNDCVLSGGETSEQPKILEDDKLILSASGVGIVEKDKIINGSKIQEGDIVIGLASNGIHTNGYSLVRGIMDEHPHLKKDKKFLSKILEPHFCYYNLLKDLFDNQYLVGMAHITGGGIQENLNRILPSNLDADIDMSKIKILPIFNTIHSYTNMSITDMFRTFNMGVGMCIVVRNNSESYFLDYFNDKIDAYIIGEIVSGNKKVNLR